jgi:hypothetical protein
MSMPELSAETTAEREAIVATWLAKPREYEICPERVWDAHLELQGRGCEETDEPCPICFVYCEMCSTHYNRDETCHFH